MQTKLMPDTANDNHDKAQFKVTVNLSKETIELLDNLKMEYGARTRGRVIEMLLQDLIAPE